MPTKAAIRESAREARERAVERAVRAAVKRERKAAAREAREREREARRERANAPIRLGLPWLPKDPKAAADAAAMEAHRAALDAGKSPETAQAAADRAQADVYFTIGATIAPPANAPDLRAWNAANAAAAAAVRDGVDPEDAAYAAAMESFVESATKMARQAAHQAINA